MRGRERYFRLGEWVRPTMSAVVLTLAVVGLTACVFPARRATRVDPVTVLREQ